MQLTFAFVALAAALTAYAGPCSWYPGTNITDSFDGLFTMQVTDTVTGVTSPLNLVIAVDQPMSGLTWEVLSVRILVRTTMCHCAERYVTRLLTSPAMDTRNSKCPAIRSSR